MASLKRHEADALISALQGKNCCGHDFYRVVRAIQAARPDMPLIGTSKSPQDDPLRFGQRPSLAFQSSTLDELIAGETPKLYVNFFGLFGPNGPLPLHLTQYALRRQLGQDGNDLRRPVGVVSDGTSSETAPQRGGKDNSLGDFLDVFHHRLLSLFFRAWASCQPAVDLDRGTHQRFLFFLGAFFGESVFDLNDDAFGAGDEIPLSAKIFYTGHLAASARNADGLESILTGYFGMNALVTEFVGRWFDLPPEDRMKLDGSSGCGSLGHGLIIGSKTWDAQLSFRVRMGPMGLEDYSRLLPKETGFGRLKSWIMNYCGAELFWDLQLVLRAGEVPSTQLGRSGKIGWTTWLKTKPFEQDADNLIIQTE
jgi:type VI secretion system protein ImpH